MAKVILASHIESLHGRLGNVIHYNVCGFQYARSYTIPRNPKTAEQQVNRLSFADAVKLWQGLSLSQKACYNRAAEGKPLSGYNLFISLRMKGLTLKILKQLQGGRVKAIFVPASALLRLTSVSASVSSGRGGVYNGKKRIIPGKPPDLTSLAA